MLPREYDFDQSLDAVLSIWSHDPLTLSPSLSANGLEVRAQWYRPQEWFAEAEVASTTATTATSPASDASFFNFDPLSVVALARSLLSVSDRVKRGYRSPHALSG